MRDGACLATLSDLRITVAGSLAVWSLSAELARYGIEDIPLSVPRYKNHNPKPVPLLETCLANQIIKAISMSKAGKAVGA